MLYSTKCSTPVSSLQCPIPCNKMLDCSHDCPGTCGKCNMGQLHIHIGGCLKQCNWRLECGHVCRSPCHPIDREHKKMYKCQQKCCKDLPCGHKCQSKCYQCQDGCTPCTTNVPRILEGCGHEVRMKCSTDQSTVKCYRKCERLIGCDHQCQNKCFEDCTPTRICQAKVDKKMPCGHVVQY